MPAEEIRDKALTPETLDYETRLREMALEEGVPEAVISDRGFTLAARFLEEVRRQHGDPDTSTYKEHHNDSHALDVIRNSWRQWVPLREKLPRLFDEAGFELLMLAGAAHDIIYDPTEAREHPGANERASAELAYGWMIIAEYDEPDARRVHDAIIKTTVRYDEADDTITQIKMRQGSKDIMGLILGRADMSGILIQGPDKLYDDTMTLHEEHNGTALQKGKALLNPAAALAQALRGEEPYLRDRVAALSADLRHYVEDEADRTAIIAVYHDEFGSASRQALRLAHNLHSAPEVTRRLADEALAFAGRAAHRGIDQATAVKQYMLDHLKFDQHDD